MNQNTTANTNTARDDPPPAPAEITRQYLASPLGENDPPDSRGSSPLSQPFARNGRFHLQRTTDRHANLHERAFLQE